MQKEGIMKVRRIWSRTLSFLLSAVIAAAAVSGAYAEEEYYEDGYSEEEYYEEYNEDNGWEEDDVSSDGEESGDDSSNEEEEYIPETYYESIQTNELTGWPQGQHIQAASAIVMDLDTNAVLYGKNVFDSHYPASITKVMTLLVAVEHGNLDDVIVCSEEVFNIEAESSHAGIAPGEKVTLRQALYGLMLESANDLGMAIAEYTAGSVSAFADMMNEKAKELGCVNTHFVNPHGLHDDDHYTCAYDMALIGQAAYANPVSREFMSTVEANIPPTNKTKETRYFINHHRMLRDDSEYYRSWCRAGKTGFTDEAWNTLITFGEKNDLRLVCVVLRENGLDRSYIETTDLMNYGFDGFSHKATGLSVDSPTFYELIGFNYPNPGGTIFQSEELKQKVIAIKQPGKVTLPKAVGTDKLTTKASGREPGRIEYYYEGELVGSGQISFTPLPNNIRYDFEKKLDMDQILEKAEDIRRTSEIEQTAQKALENVKELGQTVYSGTVSYVENNRMTVVLAGALVLFVLLILIAILIMRVTGEYRINRRRKIEERQRLRREEEIDRKSAAEIEEELREVMKKEKRQKEAEERRLAREREKEEKLREAENVLEEIERMEKEEAIIREKTEGQDI